MLSALTAPSLGGTALPAFPPAGGTLNASLFSAIEAGAVSDEHRHHRIHAALTRGNSVDIGRYRVRLEGEASDEKRAMAYRLCFVWNMAEGIPLAALEAGAVADFHLAAMELLQAVTTDCEVPAAASRLRAAHVALQLDLTGGRLHDCPQCLVDDVGGDPKAPAP